MRVLDLFAGPGGWDEGQKFVDPERARDTLGFEWCPDACATARNAGHWRDCRDIASLDYLHTFGPIEGLIASPPCQAYSRAGKGLGHADRPRVERCLLELAVGNDTRAMHRSECQDPRSLLTVEPLRWALALRPRWIACEQVPGALALFTLMASILAGEGYSVTVGCLSAEQYGVPQTRRRAFMLASLDHEVTLPEPTHSRYYPRSPAKLDDGVLPWVSMAEALGWQYSDTVLRSFRSNRAQPNAAVRASERPAPTLAFGRCMPVWVYQRPATTVICDPRIGRPGRHDPAESGSQQRDAVRVTATEAAVLQSFRADYPWQGTKTKQFQQIGNAVPPLLAAAVLKEVIR